ncbi:hypothetical protein Pmani_006802 [Petrolisthes manimaculis]|uniref:Uncharacterized protein n=1 Tax=Petrolisthes manimaculis TaxID=1843537 RepID=A0AAE1QBW2_9EUCA|nr:hypothetical protein Pmani_006802 [Petrolisthes manimaculis]
MYNYNYTEVVDMGYEAAIVNKSSLTILSPNPVKCLHRDFNHSQYQSTVVTEVINTMHDLRRIHACLAIAHGAHCGPFQSNSITQPHRFPQPDL